MRCGAIALLFWALGAACLPAAGATATVEMGAAPRLALSGQVEWCASNPAMGVAEAANGGCAFRRANADQMARGFSSAAYWLRLTLHNTEAREIERWLRIGNPRLEQVSLFDADPGGAWRRLDAGLQVPRARRALGTRYPVLPVTLKAGETRTVYVRVVSQSAIDLTATLYAPNAYNVAHQGQELAYAMAIGAALLLVVFSLLFFAQQRDRVWLYFAANLFFDVLLISIYKGFFATYLWPANLAFSIWYQTLAAALASVFFVLLVWTVTANRRGILACTMLACAASLLLADLWSLKAGHARTAPLMAAALLSVLLSGNALLIQAWRAGSRQAGYLLAGYAAMLLMFLYWASVVFGWGSLDDDTSLPAWRFVLVMLIALAGIARVTRESRKARQDADADKAARVRFVAQMSHEVRAPLNTILGYAELLERGSQRVSLRESVGEIKRSGHYLLEMVDEILEHARGEAQSPELSLQAVSLQRFFDTLKKSTAMMVGAGGNRFFATQEGQLQTAVLIDERRLRQVLDNLLSNSNRYTEKGDITLTCSVAAASGQRVRLSFCVADTGAGIEAGELSRIFQPFMRGAAARSSGIDGSGIGLAIAQQLVQLMGGIIGVESQPGVGSRFFFAIECGLAVAPLPPLAASEFPLAGGRAAFTQEPASGDAGIARPPMALLAPLKVLIEAGAVTRIADWADNLTAQYPEYRPYAASIATANLTLDFDALRRLTGANAPEADDKLAERVAGSRQISDNAAALPGWRNR